MEGKSRDSCPCTVCKSVSGPALPMRGTGGGKSHLSTGKSSAAKSLGLGRPSKKLGPSTPIWTDEERTPDVIRTMIDQLKRERRLKRDIDESLSMDWRAERRILPRLLEALPKQPSFVPRVGELVLFVPELEAGAEICIEDDTDEHKVFVRGAFKGHPRWQAGVVAQGAQVQLRNITEGQEKKHSTLSGFRIEPLPALGSDDKTASKRFRYVPLHWVRPFTFWPQILKGVPESNWHETVRNALAANNTFSLVERYEFKGKWPQAKVLCRGVFRGAELWVEGDAVRIVHDKEQNITDVLHIDSVVLELTNLDQTTDNDDDDRHPYNSSVHLLGQMYTTDPSRAMPESPEPVPKALEQSLPKGMHGYRWYCRHDMNHRSKVPLTKVLGRCFEAEAMRLWFPSEVNPSLNPGLSGYEFARNYAKQQDNRIMPEKQLYWADSRGDALDIKELNGVLLSSHDPERDQEKLDDWASATKMLASKAGMFDQYRLTQKAQKNAEDSALPSIEGGAQQEEDEGATEDDDIVDEERVKGFQLPSATPSDELNIDESSKDVSSRFGLGQGGTAKMSKAISIPDDETDDADESMDAGVAARFGIGKSSPRKRSRSVSGIDKSKGSDSDDVLALAGKGKWRAAGTAKSDGPHKLQKSSDDSDEGNAVKGVASGLTRPLAKVGKALGFGGPAAKKRRTESRSTGSSS